MKALIRILLLLAMVLPPVFLQAAKVSQITGYSKKAPRVSSEEEETLKTEEQIAKALKVVQEKDIATYNRLVQIRESNFNQFISDLQQWMNDDNPAKTSHEKKRLNNLLRKLDFELGTLSQAYAKETDEGKKLELQKQISSKVSVLAS